MAIGVLSPARDTEWGLPTFLTPKKDNTVRFVSDLRELNAVIKKDTIHTTLDPRCPKKKEGLQLPLKIGYFDAVLHILPG